jgi:hypothetical protein
MNRDALQRVVVIAGAVLLSLAAVVRLAGRGAPYFARPRTIVDHAGPREHETRQALILLPEVAPLLPRGAEVTCFRPRDGKAWNDDAVYLASVGLLPHQSVLPPWTAATDLPRGELVEYVIAVGGPFDHPAYVPLAGFPDGWLYKRR